MKKKILYVLQFIQWIQIETIICNYLNYTIYINMYTNLCSDQRDIIHNKILNFLIKIKILYL